MYFYLQFVTLQYIHFYFNINFYNLYYSNLHIFIIILIFYSRKNYVVIYVVTVFKYCEDF
jgi:hypothetical protein